MKYEIALANANVDGAGAPDAHDYNPDEPVDTHESHEFEYEGDEPAACRHCGTMDYHPIAEKPCPKSLQKKHAKYVAQSDAEQSMLREIGIFYSGWKWEPALPTLAEWRANYFEWSRTFVDSGEELKACNRCRLLKPLSAYQKSKAHRQGVQPRCRECRKGEGK